MSDQPEISVLIPCYNAAGTIRDCLDAVFRSNFKSFEVIVVDDASTDDTIRICREYKCSILQNDSNSGPSHCRNRAAAAARAGIVLYIDSDILIAPDTLERVAAFFRDHPDVHIFQGRYSDTSYYKNVFSRYKNARLAFREISRREGDVAFINTSLVAMQKPVLEQYHFDESIRRAEDSLFGWRYHQDGNRIVLDHSFQAVHMKQYTLATFMRYQFRSGHDLVMNWMFKGMGKAVLSETNSLSNRLQLLRAPLSLLFAAALLAAPFLPWTLWLPILAVLLALAAALQIDFLNYVRKTDGFTTAAAYVFIYLLDGFVSALGVAWGLLRVLAGRRPEAGSGPSRQPS